MSDREYIIQEIRKLFKEQAATGDVAKVAGTISPAPKKKPSTSTVSVAPKVQNPNKTAIVTIGDVITYDPSIPEEYKKRYYQSEISPGMDRGETGDCKFINSAAIKENPSLKEPVYIYQVLANAGIVALVDPIPLKPCDGLDKLIAQFQTKALQGKLKFQDKRNKENIASLYYRAGKEVEDLGKGIKLSKDIQKARQALAQAKKTGGTQTAVDKPPPQKPATNEQVNNSEIAVDGKIGSRTAKLFKLFEPGAKPVAPAPAKKTTTTTTSKKATTTSTSKATTSGKCNFWVQDPNDLKRQISQTMFGVPCDELNILHPQQKKWNMIINKSHFNDFRSSTLDGVPIDNNDIQPFERTMNRYKNGLKTKAANVIAFVAKKAIQKEKARIKDLAEKFDPRDPNFVKALKLSKKQDPPIKVPKEMWAQDDIGFITNSLGDMVVTLYLSDIGFKRALNFTIFSKMNPQTGRPDSYIPIIWSTYPSAASIEAGFIMGGLKGLELLSVDNPFKIDKKHFKNDSAEVNKTLKSVYDVYNICKKYSNLYNTADRAGMGNLDVLSSNYMKEDGINTLNRYIYKLKELINRIRDFQANPNPETLEKLGKICMSVSPMWANYDRIDYL